MSIQIKKKFLRSQSVDGSKVLFLNEDSFKALKSDGSEASLFKLDSQNKFQLLEMPRVSSDPTHENELARKSYVDAGDAAEALARAAADAAEQAARETEDAAIRAEFAAADALSLLEAKEYTDEKVSEEAAARSAEDADIREEFAVADLFEKTAREAADQLLRDDLDAEIATRTLEDIRVLSDAKAYTDVEKARAMAAEAAEQAAREAADLAEAALRASEDVRVLSEANAYTDLEKARAMAAEAAEAAARAAEDLTFLKLDGSRSMEGNLNMEKTIPGSAGAVASYSVTNPSPGVGNVSLTLLNASFDGSIWVGFDANSTGPDQAQPPMGSISSGTGVLPYSSGPYGMTSVWAVPNSSGSPDFTNSIKLGILDYSKLDQTAFTPEGGVGGSVKYKIVGLSDGTASNDAVNKSQLDASLVEAKAYTDSSIASVIDAAPEAYNTLREIAEYIASDQSATTQILSQLYDHETRLDVIEGTGEGSIAKAEADAMAYTDAEKTRAMAAEAGLQSDIDAEESRAMAQEAAIRSEFAAADAAIVSDLEDLDGYAQDIRSDLEDLDGYAQDIRSDLDQEILDRIADVDAEEARALAAEAAEAAARAAADAAETAARIAADLAEATLRASEDARILSESKAYTDVEVLAEKTRAMAVEAGLQSEIDAEEVLRASEDVRVLSDSKAYTDQKVAAVIDSAPEMLDTLRELAQALGNDENFATSVTGYIAAAKEEAKDYAEAQVDAFGERLAIESFEVSSTIITDNYIELQNKAFAMSIVASVDRLMMLEGEDYQVSVQNGKTRLTFGGSMIQGQEEALALGDKLRVRYLKDVRP